MKAIRKQSPIERTIFLKKKLISRLRKEIVQTESNAAFDIKKLQFRIQMAQTLVDALEKGK